MLTNSQNMLSSPTDLGPINTKHISTALNLLLADVYALYLKTKNFHWHMSGPHFQEFHVLFDDQATQIFAMTDVLAERVRKLGGHTLTSIGSIAKLQRIKDNDADFVTPQDMLTELGHDNRKLTGELRLAHDVCSESRDFATTSQIEIWIDEAERRTWFLYESSRKLGSHN